MHTPRVMWSDTSLLDNNTLVIQYKQLCIRPVKARNPRSSYNGLHQSRANLLSPQEACCFAWLRVCHNVRTAVLLAPPAGSKGSTAILAYYLTGMISMTVMRLVWLVWLVYIQYINHLAVNTIQSSPLENGPKGNVKMKHSFTCTCGPAPSTRSSTFFNLL